MLKGNATSIIQSDKRKRNSGTGKVGEVNYFSERKVEEIVGELSKRKLN